MFCASSPASVDGSDDINIVDRELTPRQQHAARSGRSTGQHASPSGSPSGSGSNSGSGSGGEYMMLDADPFYEAEEREEEGEEDDMSEMGGHGAGAGGAGGVGNATLVVGEKRKHRDRAI